MGLIITYVTGCAWLPSKEVASDRELYLRGERLFKEGKYRRAGKLMDKLLQEYFESEYKPRALFILAETQFMRNKYEEAQFNYDKFLELHPTHDWAEKAAYRSTLCDFNRILSSDKDQTITLRTLEKFTKFLQRYPRSQYREEVEKRISFTRHRLAEQEFYVANFYMKTKAYGPAILRYRKLLKDYPGMDFEDQVLFSLGRAYQKRGEKKKARETFKRLYLAYPNSKLGRKAKGRM
jgi:outer membrane protein assembly factor BamD